MEFPEDAKPVGQTTKQKAWLIFRMFLGWIFLATGGFLFAEDLLFSFTSTEGKADVLLSVYSGIKTTRISTYLDLATPNGNTIVCYKDFQGGLGVYKPSAGTVVDVKYLPENPTSLRPAENFPVRMRGVILMALGALIFIFAYVKSSIRTGRLALGVCGVVVPILAGGEATNAVPLGEMDWLAGGAHSSSTITWSQNFFDGINLRLLEVDKLWYQKQFDEARKLWSALDRLTNGSAHEVTLKVKDWGIRINKIMEIARLEKEGHRDEALQLAEKSVSELPKDSEAREEIKSHMQNEIDRIAEERWKEISRLKDEGKPDEALKLACQSSRDMPKKSARYSTIQTFAESTKRRILTEHLLAFHRAEIKKDFPVARAEANALLAVDPKNSSALNFLKKHGWPVTSVPICPSE